jgi:hypothetical protein
MKRRHCHRARKNRGLAECGITQKHSGRLRLIFAKRGGPRKQIECEKSPAAIRAFPFYLATPGWTVLFVPPTVLVVPPRSQTKHPIARMIGRSQFPGRNHPPKGHAISCSRITRLVAPWGLPPGTDFLDAETGRQKPAPKCADGHRDRNPRI